MPSLKANDFLTGFYRKCALAADFGAAVRVTLAPNGETERMTLLEAKVAGKTRRKEKGFPVFVDGQCGRGAALFWRESFLCIMRFIA
jgi:hypothetical protein